ncbi:MAG: GNAT family N-acetyltransferase, partial [Acidobacteriales bacterium]|nr:GNAT family N-acetyltransferase [Terriglobales bacterium]
VATIDDELIAFCAAKQVAYDEWELENLFVVSGQRRKGLARQLLSGLQASIGSSARLYLEVREQNHAARVLYESLGFQKTGMRKRYYREPDDDALLYQWCSSSRAVG